MAPRRVRPMGPGVDALPPPGDARRETLKARLDDLTAEAERLGAEMGTIDPAKLRPENEIASQLVDDGQGHANTMLPYPPHANPNYEYGYKRFDSTRGTITPHLVQEQNQGWEIVRPSDPDAVGLEHLRHVANWLAVGDVLLMRIRKDRYLTILQHRAARQRAIESGVTSELDEIAEKYRGQGVIVHTPGSMSPEMLKRMAGRATAQHLAGQRFDQMIRSGSVPGMPGPNVA